MSSRNEVLSSCLTPNAAMGVGPSTRISPRGAQRWRLMHCLKFQSTIHPRFNGCWRSHTELNIHTRTPLRVVGRGQICRAEFRTRMIPQVLCWRWRNSERGGGAKREILSAAEAGIHWLLALQNSDGGMPTFCRGWGALPFDRSSADITAHAVRAWTKWNQVFDERTNRRVRSAQQRAMKFLRGAQKDDGSWLPLWFGNQYVADDENRNVRHGARCEGRWLTVKLRGIL